MMGPSSLGFRPPPPKPRYHGHSRSSFGLTKWVWSTLLALCEGSGLLRLFRRTSLIRRRSLCRLCRLRPPVSPDSPVSPTSPVSPVSPDSVPVPPTTQTSTSSAPLSPTAPTPRSPTDGLPYPLTSHPSFLRLRRARPALLEEEDHRPSEPPVNIYPRMGDLRSLHDKGESGVKVDRGWRGGGVDVEEDFVGVCCRFCCR
ncbi:hypothetical protein DFP72DRAFT_868651 [Ephemerocybe angulata]|uniref:Uncharacterized protein n=1 Tax=Ephemerocybe angulata TaxID=980116 RepID=A0A8H6IK63_9AGAR|nr:hypothetical protein DFP72DRAFT_868651 [Tulosesus angulatus]